MVEIDPSIIAFFAIPLSYFIVIFSVLLIQYGTVNIISGQIGRTSFNHPRLVRAMNWWGIFIHELSHAITAIVTLNKVKEFKVSSTGGHVVHETSGKFGFLKWVAAQSISLAPAFMPPIMVALLMHYLGYIDFIRVNFNAGDPVSIIYALYLDLIPFIIETTGWLFIKLNYLNVGNFLLLLFLTFSFSSAKPSSISGKTGNQGDIQSVIQMSIKFPIYTFLFMIISILFFWILFRFNIPLFSIVLTYLLLLPVLSIFGLLFNYLFIMLVNMFNRSSILWIIIALAASILVYAGLMQYGAAQYIINISSIAVLVGFLKLLR
ncbi:MAG: hypothetical protein Q8M95_02955 [Candidatus Methanoperedens sp.]|nr:hypothetical protein [Candidatus Methanoperedens sp.]